MPPLIVIFAAGFGAASAAFLPHLAYRLAVGHAGEPRSACAVCFRLRTSWVRVGAACSCSGGSCSCSGGSCSCSGGSCSCSGGSCSCSGGYGRNALGGGFGWTVLAGAAVASLLAVGIGPAPQLPILLLAAVPGLLLAMIDLRCLRLPDRLVGLLAVIAVPPLGVLRPERIGLALVAFVAVLVAYGFIALLPRRPLGLGDVKLAVVLALILGFAGWPAVVIGLLAPHLINGPVALFLLVTRRAKAVPFGPALLAGALLAVTTMSS